MFEFGVSTREGVETVDGLKEHFLQRMAWPAMVIACSTTRNPQSAIRNRKSKILNESGQVLFQVVAGLVALLALVGFAVDGGLMLAHYQRDKLALDAAAQVASHAIDWPYWESTQQIRLDDAAAYRLAQYYANLNSRDAIGNLNVYAWPPNNPQRVVVAGTARIPTTFWRILGIREIDIRMTSAARPAHGISREGQ